jgi:hypothetical protein
MQINSPSKLLSIIFYVGINVRNYSGCQDGLTVVFYKSLSAMTGFSFFSHFSVDSNALFEFCHTSFEVEHMLLQEIFACRVSL